MIRRRGGLEEFLRLSGRGLEEACAALERITADRLLPMSLAGGARDIDDIAGGRGAAARPVVALHQALEGIVGGRLVIAWQPGYARFLISRLTGTDPPHIEDLSALQRSALMEVGNTVSAAWLNVVSDRARRKLIPSVPEVGCDMMGAVLQEALAAASGGARRALVVTAALVPARGGRPVADLFVLPDPEGLAALAPWASQSGGL